jgi:hypothetical protein
VNVDPCDTAWRAEQRDDAALTLTAPLRRAATDEAGVSFQLWYDTEPTYDRVTVETSTDDGETWQPASFRLWSPTSHWRAEGSVSGYGGRQWWQVSAELDPGTTDVRWSYLTGPEAQVGRVGLERTTGGLRVHPARALCDTSGNAHQPPALCAESPAPGAARESTGIPPRD